MKITVNGVVETISEEFTLAKLVEIKAIPTEGLVLVVDDDVVKSDIWSSTFLKEGMNIELLNFVSGG